MDAGRSSLDRLEQRHTANTQGGYVKRGEFALLDSIADMTYIVTETCVDLKDKSCIEVCPVDCIHEAPEDRMVFIDPDECIDCGACVDPCPVDAIYAEEDVPEAQVLFVDINKVYFKDKALARSQVSQIKPPDAT